MVKDKYLLIDGDLIRYRCGFAVENDEIYKQGTGTDKSQRIREFVNVVLRSITGTGPEFAGEIWLSGPTNFREAISKSKPYKANRKDRIRPTAYEEIGSYLIDEYGAQVTDGIEADDRLAIGLTRDPEGRCIVGNDKDFLQVSGWHYNWIKRELQWVSRKAGDFSLYAQILSGDTTDNVPGITGIGPRKASKLLEGSQSSKELCERTWNAYRTLCRDCGDVREYFIEQASLIYLLRREDDHFTPPITLEVKV